MAKHITCGPSVVRRAANEAQAQEGEDYELQPMTDGSVAVHARSLLGQLFLSLLACGALPS